jgi:hypothetical protein
MFISFLLSRRFRGKTYVSLTTAMVLVISFFSFGLPSMASSGAHYPTPSYYPLPLSFPFYSLDITHPSWGMFQVLAESYELYFLGFLITETWDSYPLLQGHSPFTAIFFLAYFQFFLLINLAGAIFGYWINKIKFIEKYFTRRQLED